MFVIVTRTLEWTLAKEPLKRHIRPANSTPSVIKDAIDLAINLRGYGWDWSKGLHVPRKIRPVTRTRFVACAVLSADLHAVICDTLQRAVQSFSHLVLSVEAPIFDEALPFFIRYLRATIMSTLGACVIYCVLQMGYDLCTFSFSDKTLYNGHLRSMPRGSARLLAILGEGDGTSCSDRC
ncbi:hypothetical protein BU15DRAFT_70226 [Melanogaster broomeanus]|nr:hypothetical protein BU15DRAFT_73069 [Melanogaster broomeanus]KAF9246105.1 hypothetical protein BU15DRAFT_70226 [Melanogaster broomeanus]